MCLDYCKSKENKHILMFTFHLWESNRRGGFHYLAEKWAQKGYWVDFVTYPYSFSALWMRDERLNVYNLAKLMRGKRYKIGQGVIHNFGVPGLVLPYQIEDKLPFTFLKQLYTWPSYFLEPRLEQSYKMIVLESYLCIVLFNWLKKRYSTAKIIYRPSDPMVALPCSTFRQKIERSLLRDADLVVNWNEQYQNFYFQCYQELASIKDHFQVIPNGIDLDKIEAIQSWPSQFRADELTAVYVGVADVDWDLIFYAACRLKNIKFIIVIPRKIKQTLSRKIAEAGNIKFIEGVSPHLAIAYLKCASAVILPYTYKGSFSEMVALSAKVLYAMYYQRPIIGTNICAQLKDYGVLVCQGQEEFATALAEAIRQKDKPTYPIDFREYHWARLAERFMGLIKV